MNGLTRNTRLSQVKLLSGLFVAATLLMACESASASFVLDTGTPNGTSTYDLSTAQSIAGEFLVTAGQTVTDLSAYLTVGAGQPGDVFSFEIFSNTGFINGRSVQPVFATTATFTTNGWTSEPVSWTPAVGGDYWLAVVASPGTLLDLPGEASSSTGTVPALGFAVTSGGKYISSNATAIGLEVTAVSPVPLPTGVLLLGSGLLAGLGLWLTNRRRFNPSPMRSYC